MASTTAFTSIRQEPPTAGPDDPMPLESVDHDQFVKALRPALDLVGIDAMSIFADSFTITSDRIELVSVTPIAGVEPIEMGDEDYACWGWPLTVKVDLP